MSIDSLPLPNYLIEEICEHLSFEDRARLAATCRRHYSIITNVNHLFESFPAIGGAINPDSEPNLAYRYFILSKKFQFWPAYAKVGSYSLNRKISNVTALPGHRVLVSSSGNSSAPDFSYQIWNTDTPQTEPFSFPTKAPSNNRWDNFCVLTNNRLAAHSGTFLYIWSLENLEEPLVKNFEHPILSFRELSENRIAVDCANHKIFIYNIVSGEIQDPELPIDIVNCLLLSDDRIAVIAKRDLMIGDLNTTTSFFKLGSDFHELMEIDRKRFLSRSWLKVSIWNLDGHLLHQLTEAMRISSVSYLGNNQFLVRSSGRIPQCRLWNLNQNSYRLVNKPSNFHPIGLSDGGNYIITYEHSVYIFRRIEDKANYFKLGDGDSTFLRELPDGQLLLKSDGKVCVFKLSMEKIRELEEASNTTVS